MLLQHSVVCIFGVTEFMVLTCKRLLLAQSGHNILRKQKWFSCAASRKAYFETRFLQQSRAACN